MHKGQPTPGKRIGRLQVGRPQGVSLWQPNNYYPFSVRLIAENTTRRSIAGERVAIVMVTLVKVAIVNVVMVMVMVTMVMLFWISVQKQKKNSGTIKSRK
jgi:hypothetical protein